MRVLPLLAIAALSATQPVLGASYASQVGSYVASSVKAVISADTKAVLKAFAGKLPSNVLNLVETALNVTVLQNLSGTTNATQLDTLASMVNAKLAEVENIVYQGITNETFYLGTAQGANYTDLRQCLATVIRDSTPDNPTSGSSCLTLNNTAAVSDIKQIFRNMVDQYEFQIPMNTILAMQQGVNATLANSSLIPPAQDLIQAVQRSMLSVAATANADFRDAIYEAETCFFEAMSQPVYSKAFEYECNAGELNSNDSTLNNVQDIFRATVNQYAGVLPPEIVDSVQQIGDYYLPTNTSAATKATRNDVNAAIRSVVASKAGNSATMVYQMLDCLDLVMIPGAGNATTEAACMQSPTGVAASRLNIVNGYIEQFYGVLPPKLILDMRNSVLPAIQNDTSKSAQATRKKLDNLFTASGAGPAYVTCYESFENCVIAAVGNTTVSSQCQLGPDCKTIPFQTAVVDTTSPYQAAVTALEKSRNKPAPVQRAAAYAAAAVAAKTQAQSIYFAMPKSMRRTKNRKMAPARKLKPVSKSSSKDKTPNAAAVAKAKALLDSGKKQAVSGSTKKAVSGSTKKAVSGSGKNGDSASKKGSSGSKRKSTKSNAKGGAKGHRTYSRKQAKHHGSKFQYHNKDKSSHAKAVSQPKLRMLMSSCDTSAP